MTALSTSGLKNAQQDAAKDALDGGLMIFFAGPVPATAGEALNMVDDHTECFRLTIDGDGSTGLTLDAAVDGVLSKPSGDVWDGLVEFDGAEDGETTLAPTFYRFCASGDNGRGASNAPRLQDTVGGPASSAAVRLGTETVTANTINTQGLSGWTYALGD